MKFNLTIANDKGIFVVQNEKVSADEVEQYFGEKAYIVAPEVDDQSIIIVDKEGKIVGSLIPCRNMQDIVQELIEMNFVNLDIER